MSSGSSFGELVLVLGDLHVPERASKIPANFQRMLVPNKMQHVICTGNVGSTMTTAPSTSADQKSIYAKLQELAPHVHVVCGDYDSEADFPETRVVQVGMFRIGVLHGHQLVPWKCKEALQRMRRKLQVDILITGHTHQSEVVIDDGYCYINPGSITGAYSSLTPNVTPSFILLAVQQGKVVCYVYELINGEVDVSKTEYTKKVLESNSSSMNSANPTLLNSLLK